MKQEVKQTVLESESFEISKGKIQSKRKKKKGLLIGVIICILLDLGAFLCIFLAYGPISYFRDLLITTAMTTKSHKYLARTIYSEKTIEKVIFL